jgi:hypothetical protein
MNIVRNEKDVQAESHPVLLSERKDREHKHNHEELRKVEETIESHGLNQHANNHVQEE